MPIIHHRIPALVLAALALGGCPSPTPGEREGEGETGPVALIGETTGAQVSALATVGAGAVITLETAARTYVLDIGSEALAEDTQITLEEVTLPALPQAAALRLSPDGLQFLIPALLSIDSGAADDAVLVGLAFNEGVIGADGSFAVPDGAGGAAMLVEHFSSAAITDAESAAVALDDEQNAAIVAVTSASEGAARGLLARFNARVAPDIERARFGVFPFQDAARAFNRFRGDVQVTGTGGLTGGGTRTLDEVADDAFGTLQANGLELLAHRTVPVCTRERDVFDLSDFATVVRRIEGTFQELGIEAPPFTLCVSAELSVTATPTALTANTDTVTLDAALELVGFDGTREAIGASNILFDATGATGPDAVPTETGVVAQVVFTRPDVAPRSPAVRIVVSGETSDTQLATLPAPAPVVVSLQEPASGDIVASPAELSAPGTVELCAHANVSGAPVDRFAVDWSLAQPVGALEASGSVTTTGEACVTWTSPTSLPVDATDVGVVAQFDIDGATATATTSIHLAAPRGIITFVRTQGGTSNAGCIAGSGRLEMTVFVEIALSGEVTAVSGTYTNDEATEGLPEAGLCALVATASGSPRLEVTTGPIPVQARVSEAVPPFGVLSVPVVFTSTTTRSGPDTCAGVETLVDEVVTFSLPYVRTPEGHYDFTRDEPGSTSFCFEEHFTQTGVIVPD